MNLQDSRGFKSSWRELKQLLSQVGALPQNKRAEIGQGLQLLCSLEAADHL